MTKKPTYEELEQRVKELEKEAEKRKQAERELLLKNIVFDTSIVANSTADLKGIINHANDSFVRMWGYKSKNEVIGKPILHFIQDGKEAEAIISSLDKTGKWMGEYTARKKDGSTFIANANATILYDKTGKKVGYQSSVQDTTERKQAEESLKESETQKKAILDASIDRIRLVDKDMRIIWANKTTTISLNIAPEGLLGQPCYKMFFDRNAPCDGCPTKKAVDSGNIEHAVMHQPISKGIEGETYWDNYSVPIKNESGDIVNILQITRNITEQVQMENALREAYNIINRSPAVAFLWKNAEGWPVEFVSDNVEKLFGYTAKEFTSGKVSYASVVYPDDLDRVAKEVAHYSEDRERKGFVHEPYRITTKNGEVKYLDDRTYIRRDKEGRITHYEGIVIDITTRHSMEEALTESEEKYRLLVENANDAVFITQYEKIKFPNPKAEETTGYSAEELANLPLGDLIHPEYRDMLLERHRKRLAGEKLPTTYPFIIINRAGEELWVELNVALITWEGRPAVLNILRDITQQKKMEDQLQRAQKMEAIGTLAGGVAHDLNNVLAGLVSYPDLLLMDLPEDSHLRKPIQTIQKSGQKAAAIVQDLLTLARRGYAVTEVVNLNHIISEYLESSEYENLKSFHPDVHVKTDLETDLLHILGSPVHLSKTAMNLVSNASEAMSEGGTIFISTENRYIDRPIRGYDHIKDGDYVILTITDTGVGILSKDMKRIFEPFYTKKVMGRSGTGLSMAVVWGTVKDHKGYIDVQSTEGKGTTFTLYFPVTRKELARDESLVSIEDYMGRGESILVVDDVEEQREIASRILKKLGYSVTSVSSGEEAVDYLKNNSADLLVLDMIMEPGIDGLETYKRICELHPGQKAIIASGFAETDRVKEAKRLGAEAYIKKPFLLEKIGLAVKEELEK